MRNRLYVSRNRTLGRRAISLFVAAVATILYGVTIPAALSAPTTVTCTTGGTLNGGLLWLRFDTTTGTCTFTTNNTNPGTPTDGVTVLLNPGNFQLQASSSRFENGAYLGNIAGVDYDISNYSGARFNSATQATFQDTIPTTGASSTISVTTLINGSPVTFSADGITKTNGSNVTTYGTVTFTYNAGPNATDKSSIADFLLSTFNIVDDGIFGSDGVPFDNSKGGSTNSAGLMFSHNGTTEVDANEARFSLNVRQLLSTQRRGLKGPNFGSSQNVLTRTSPWDVWAKGKFVRFNGNTAGADRKGHVFSFTSGISYALSPRTRLGSFSRVRSGKVTSMALNARLTSTFFGGGLYLGHSFENRLRLLVAGYFEGGRNNINIANATGKFTTQQFSFETRVDRRFEYREMWIEPAIQILYTNLKRGGYVDSSNAVVPSSRLSIGRIIFGPSVGTTIDVNGAVVKPFARIGGEWFFAKSGDFTLSTGPQVSSQELALKLGGGVEVMFENNIAVKLSAEYSHFDHNFESVTVNAKVNVPLSAFIDENNRLAHSMLSFAISADKANQSAKLKFNMPLGFAR